MDPRKVFLSCVMLLCYLGFSASLEQPSNHLPSHDKDYIRDLSENQECSFDVQDKVIDCNDRGLTEVPNDLPADVLDLYMYSNNIQTLRNSSFQRYLELKVILLGNNDIRVIETGTFYSLKYLVYLALNDNKHFGLPTIDIFRYSNKLMHLSIGSCGISFFPNNIFQWLPNLQELSFLDNRVKFFNATHTSNDSKLMGMDREDRSSQCSVDFIELAGNPVEALDPLFIQKLPACFLRFGGDVTQALSKQTIPDHVFSNLFTGLAKSTTQELSLSFTNFSCIIQDVFNPLRNTSVSGLDLEHNKCSRLQHFVFSNLTNVIFLNLKGNHLESIEPEFFEGMNNLETLILSLNDIGTVNPLNSTWKINLRKLDVSGNVIRIINADTFRGLHRIESLYLGDNEFFSLSITISSPLRNLRYLDVSPNVLGDLSLYTPYLQTFICQKCYFYYLIPGETFEVAKSLQYIDLTLSKLTSRSIWDSEKNVSLFHELYDLNILILDGIQISHLPPRSFADLKSMEHLSLKDCNISEIDSMVLSGMSSLLLLDLRNNKIKTLPSDLFDNLAHLIILKLDGNDLTYLEDSLFMHNPFLTNLTISNNQINIFEHNTFRPIMSNLSVIDLSGNPISCTCQIKWLISWLKTSGTLHVLNVNSTICSVAQWNFVVGKQLLNFNPDDVCKVNITLFYVVPLALIALSVISIAAFHYRWLIGYKFFLLKLSVLGYNEMQDARDPEDFEFDINVMFTVEDDAWMRGPLKDGLRRMLPQFDRNVFGDDDLMPGMHYLDAVLHVVENSFKTILLLSRAAIEDNWFLMKCRVALDYVNDIQTEKILVICLEDIPRDELPSYLKLYINDRTCITWEGHGHQEEQFWRNLVKRLTTNLRRDHLIPPE